MDMLNQHMLDPHIRGDVESCCRRLIDQHGANIISIILYGSSTRGEFLFGKSDVNMLVVCRRIPISSLIKTRRFFWWARLRRMPIAPPLFLTQHLLESSIDLFPAEFLEIKYSHILLYGQDTFNDLHIERDYLLLECNRQLKGSIIRLRQYFLESGMRSHQVMRFLTDMMTGAIMIFRNLLRAQDKIPPTHTRDVVIATCAAFDIDQGVFMDVLHYKNGIGRHRQRKPPQIIFARFINQLQKLSKAVDRLN